MFKRLLFFSFIVAFILSCLVMWLWYLPKQEADRTLVPESVNQTPADSVMVSEPSMVVE
jgi:hypothetical protein